MGFSRQEYRSGLPFPSLVDHIVSDLSTMTHPSWLAPYSMAYFHWVRQGCGPSMIRLTSFLWLWFQCVCPLATHIILLGFLLAWTWGICSQLIQQSAAAAPYLGRGLVLHCRPSWPWMWNSSLFNTEIRLIIFFAAKDGEALYSQQKQDQELTWQ